MKKNMIYWVSLALLGVLNGVFVSCEDKDEIPGPSYQQGVWFYGSGNVTSDNKLNLDKFNEVFSGFYSFYFHPGRDVDTIALAEIRLMGNPMDYDREVNLVAGEGTTAEEGVHYRILGKVLPANAVSFIPKVLLIKENLGEDEKVIKFELRPSAEFPALVVGDTVAEDKTFSISLHYKLTFSNLISEPPYWKQTNGRFREWSRVKYEFMIEKLGKYWGAEPLSPSDMTDMYNDVLRMRQELAAWEKAHNGEKMKDENGKEISF